MTQTHTTPTRSPKPVALSAAQMLEIEDRARQMRAEAIRFGASHAAAWVKTRFAALFAGAGQRA